MAHRIAAKITGVAGCVPPKILTNADLEKMVATNDEWIRTRTGIRERRIVEKGTPTSHLAVQAAKALLTQTKTDPTEIDLIVPAATAFEPSASGGFMNWLARLYLRGEKQ